MDKPQLRTKFRPAGKETVWPEKMGPVVGFAATDLDLDYDLDLLTLMDQAAPAMVLNGRLLRFQRPELGESLAPSGMWNGALVLDVNQDERSDLLLVGEGRRPELLIHARSAAEAEASEWFTPGLVDAPPLAQAQAIDINLDGWTDILGRSSGGKPVLLVNDGQRLVHHEQELMGLPHDLATLSAVDLGCDGSPDLAAWTETNGLRIYRSFGNGRRALKLIFNGHRRVEPNGSKVRSNVEGFGVRVLAQAGTFATTAEFTTLSAGLGQSLQPLTLGMARHAEAELLLMRWPDLCWQGEFNIPTSAIGDLRCGVVMMHEQNRKEVSCPILFTWDGHRFVYITDFLGAGTVGESLAGGGFRPPRPEESVKIETRDLAPRNGEYVMKVAEPMNEVTYLDRLQLVVVDRPAGVRVYPDERFGAGGPAPTQELLAFQDEIFPVHAKDHRGHDMTKTLQSWDRETVDRFHRRTWLGFAEEHSVELNFGDRLSKFSKNDRLVLFLAGWTDYPFPESIWAANQAGVPMIAPILERRGEDGQWHKIADAGFPAGLPRIMTLDVTGLLTGPGCQLRLRTNMHVFWDQIFVAPITETVNDGICLEVTSASLAPRRLLKEFSPDGQEPTVYDYDRLDAFPVVRPSGMLTRYGDVTELMQTTDDRFVLIGPGDDLTIKFQAKKLPPLRQGWERSFVLRSWGYCKDCAPFTACGATVGPLPFRAMSRYPYGLDETYPHPDYQKKYNTRPSGPVWHGPPPRRTP